ncbi:MAG: carbamoyltransferase [Candidatus Eisenbacteria bacterium]|nr:carbamoyltransferase [Candidatus Eisenbacteria bacterium]
MPRCRRAAGGRPDRQERNEASMRILGLGDGMTGGVALIEDGRLAAVISEERLTRQKMAIGFPQASLDELLRQYDLAPARIDRVMVATREGYFRESSHAYEGWFPKEENRLPQTKRRVIHTASSRLAQPLLRNRWTRRTAYTVRSALLSGRRSKLTRLLRERYGFRCPILFVNHHYAHAAGAYHTCGFPDALVVTLDGAGDGDSSHVYEVRGGRFRLRRRVDSYDSIGNYYGYITHICGFTAHKHEGKITGLAAHGAPRYADLLRRFITNCDGSIANVGGVFFATAVDRLRELLPADFAREDVASSMQHVLEETVTRYVDTWRRRTGLARLALSGGVFANVRLNQKLHEMEGVESVFVHPGMGDEGLALGAALAGWMQVEPSGAQRPPLRDVYLGPEYGEDEMTAALDADNLPRERPEDFAGAVAEHLAAGRVVARFAGRMEYGPRALGNRSILYQPTDPSVNDWLNKRLQRTEFMPFAPVTRSEDAARLYAGIGGAQHTAEFMTITFDCTPELRAACPAVVHVDGTARPQLLRREINPDYYDILDAYIRRTGIPSLINTSFNMHEEPIVCSPADAIRAFRQGHLDVLAIGPYMVRHPELAARPGQARGHDAARD